MASAGALFDIGFAEEENAPGSLDFFLAPGVTGEASGLPIRGAGDALRQAILLLERGENEAALRAASDACHEAPERPEPHYVYGQSWLRLGDFAHAERAFAAALQIAPDWADAWVNYGVVRFRQSALDDAVTAMRQALRHAPRNSAAQANLTAFLALKREREAQVRVLEVTDPARAFGLATEYLMRKPAFARLPFGEWADILHGMVTRGHFRLFAGHADRVAGFFGWALATEAAATDWVEGRRKLRSEDCLEGDCVIYNAWAAESSAIHRFMVGESRRLFAGKRAGFYKRFYPDGRVRPARLPGNGFVGNHVRRAGERSGDSPEGGLPES